MSITGLVHRTCPARALGVEWLDLETILGRGERYDVTVNLATCYGRGGEGLAELVRTNVALPNALLDSGVCDGGVFVNAGTALPPGTNEYSLSKHQFVDWLGRQAERRDLLGINAALQHFYGPGDSEHKFPTWLLRTLLRGDPSVDLSSGTQRRDFIYVDDVVSAFCEIVLRSDALTRGAVNEIPIGSGQAVSIREFCLRMVEIVGAKTELRFGAIASRSEEPDLVVSPGGWLELKGWLPAVGLSQGLTRMVREEKEL